MTRKPFTTRIDEGLLDKVTALAIIMDRNINDLVEEGFADLLDKYNKDDLIQQFIRIRQKAAN